MNNSLSGINGQSGIIYIDDAFDEIYDLCIDQSVDEAIEQLGKNYSYVKFVDEKIADKMDTGEYLMMRSFQVDEYYVKLYYGRDEYLINDIDVSMA